MTNPQNNESAKLRAAKHGSDVTEVSTTKDGMTVVKKRSHRHKRRRRKRILTVVAIIVGIILVIALAIGIFLFVGKSSLQSNGNAEDIQVAEKVVTYDEGKTVTYNGHTYKLNENMVSVCFMGYDLTEKAENAGKNGQADCIMVLAANLDTGGIRIISIPRDSMVDVSEYLTGIFTGQDKMQICLAFSYGEDAASGAEYTARVASRVLYNMPIKYYYALNMQGVSELNDAIGGVALTPLATIPNTNIVEGEATVLMGSNALSYVRYRDTSVLNSSLNRQERQVQYVKAFADQTIELANGNVGTIINLFNTAMANSATNLSAAEVSYIATQFITKKAKFEIQSLKGSMSQGNVYAEFTLDKTNVYETVLDVYYTKVD